MPAPLEIHVPISPTPNFLNRIHYLAASLQRAGGLAAESALVVTVGEDQEPVDLAAALPWSRKYPIRWRWLDRELFRQQSFYATAVDRFRVDFTSPMVLMLDADVVIVKDFDDLARRSQQEQVFCGAIAHISPFRADVSHPVPPQPALEQRSREEWWQEIFDRAGLGKAPFDCQHTGWNILAAPTSRYCPPYFNLGVLLAPAEIAAGMGRTIFQDMAMLGTVMSTYFRCQIGVTMSLIRSGRPYYAMPMRYNFPNYMEMAQAYPEDLEDVRIIHYINQDYLQKDRTLNSVEQVGEWLATSGPLPSVHQRLKDCFAELQPGILEDPRSAKPVSAA